MHTKQAISICWPTGFICVMCLMQIYTREKNIKAHRGDLFPKIVNTLFLTLCLFFACPQALINLWRRGSMWSWKPSPKSSLDRMNALPLTTSRTLTSGQCKSPSTVRARKKNPAFRKQIGHNDRETPKKILAQTNEKAEFYIIFIWAWNATWKLILLCFTDPPFISKARNTGIAVGQKGILQCEASAVPRAEFEWYKEDRRQVFLGFFVFFTPLSLSSDFYEQGIVWSRYYRHIKTAVGCEL